jgi:hypothetical protein
MTETKKPKISNSASQNELDKVEKQFEAFDENVKSLTMDRMNAAPTKEVEPQTKISQKDLDKSTDIYLKPSRSISSKEKFNENFRKEYEFSKEHVHFIAEHKEIIGETIELWSKPFAGMPAEEWKVPTNKPVWGPRYLAEQIKRKRYHRLVMVNSTSGGDERGNQYYGTLAADTTIQRLDAHPVSDRRSIFMGQTNFQSKVA